MATVTPLSSPASIFACMAASIFKAAPLAVRSKPSSAAISISTFTPFTVVVNLSPMEGVLAKVSVEAPELSAPTRVGVTVAVLAVYVTALNKTSCVRRNFVGSSASTNALIPPAFGSASALIVLTSSATTPALFCSNPLVAAVVNAISSPLIVSLYTSVFSCVPPTVKVLSAELNVKV